MDCDICAECGEHTDFNCCENAENGKECDKDCTGDYVSNCCGAGHYNTDPNIDMER